MPANKEWHFNQDYYYILCFFVSVADQNFFFAQTPGRFQPSFQNPRNGFFPAGSLPAIAANPNQQRTAPGTYQEQTLYGVNERPEEDEEDTTTDYLQYSPFPVSGAFFTSSFLLF